MDGDNESGILVHIGLWIRGVGLLGTILSGLMLFLSSYIFVKWPWLMWLWCLIFCSGLMTLGLGILLAKVVLDRLENEEDDYYAKKVER